MSGAGRTSVATSFRPSQVRHRQGGAGVAVVHIYRFEGDRIAEPCEAGRATPAEESEHSRDVPVGNVPA